MNIHEKIREKRIQRGMTQEEVAERLGVSAPAVNKWERGIHFPDISLLAPLARLLNTDINDLMSFREKLTAREVNEFAESVLDVIFKEGFEAGVSLVKEILREYPQSGLLSFSMASVLESMKPSVSEQSVDEIIQRLFERAADSGEKSVAEQALVPLIRYAMIEGDEEKTEEYIARLPETPFVRKKNILAQRENHRGGRENAKRLYQELLLEDVSNVLSSLRHLAEIEENPQVAQEIHESIKRILELFRFPLILTLSTNLSAAVLQQDEEVVVEFLRALEREADAGWEDDNVFTSALLKKSPDGRMQEMMMRMIVKEIEDPKESRFAFLRTSEQYRKWREEYEKKMFDNDN